MTPLKFLPSYVGSKAYWVKSGKLDFLYGKTIIEPFCGSGVISATFATKAHLNDVDPFIYKILSEYPSLIVPESFTKEDYFRVRKQADWWRYVYCLQSMSFSGVFRYSKNGYNVPVKPNIDSVVCGDRFQESLIRWEDLSPTVTCQNYLDVTKHICEYDVLILDPPYERTQASYCAAKFDYRVYWEWVRLNMDSAKTVIIFDKEDNLYKSTAIRKMRVNGAKAGGSEGMFIFENDLTIGQEGERVFNDMVGGGLTRISEKRGSDFINDATGQTFELKTDTYSMDRTDNFFIERFSDCDKETDGGPWQALNHGSTWFVYFFIKNKTAFVMNTSKLVEFLDKILRMYEPVYIPNKTWTTCGYKIPRQLVIDNCPHDIVTPESVRKHRLDKVCGA